MTTDVTIGRFGSSADVGLASWDRDGGSVRASGYLANTDRTLVQLCRQQLLGHADSPDEQIVPVTVAGDSTQDGYYRIEDASVPLDVGRYYAKAYAWTASLTRVQNFARPDIEVRSLGTVRPNIDSYTTGNTLPTVCFPGATTLVTAGSTSIATYATANGDVLLDFDAVYYDRRTRYKITPAGYYAGSCAVEQKIGSVWYPVVGRQTNAAATDVRVNNGLLRIAGYLDATPALSGLTLESYTGTGSTWGVTKTFSFRRSGSTLLTGGPYAAQIVRNRPENTIIRFSYPVAGTTFPSILTVDVSLKRGHRMADVTLNCPVSVTYVIRTGDAMTARTGGYDATSADASSMKHVIGVRSATSLTNSNFDILYGAAVTTPVVFGLGVRLTAVAQWGSTAECMNRWFAQVGETQTTKSS